MDSRRTTPFYHNETDEFLHRKIELEAERAKKAESEISASGEGEREERQKADAELKAAIEAEEARAESAEEALSSAISTEAERASSAEASIREDYLNRKTGGEVMGPIASSSHIDAQTITAKGRLNVDGDVQHSGTVYSFPEGASAEETLATESWASGEFAEERGDNSFSGRNSFSGAASFSGGIESDSPVSLTANSPLASSAPITTTENVDGRVLTAKERLNVDGDVQSKGSVFSFPGEGGTIAVESFVENGLSGKVDKSEPYMIYEEI